VPSDSREHPRLAVGSIAVLFAAGFLGGLAALLTLTAVAWVLLS
jgi:hypothetical protein